MKHILKGLLAALLVCTMTVAAAANGKFMPSVEYKGAPELVEAIDAAGVDVTSWIIVTPYSQRDTLPSHHNSSFISAYGDVDMNSLYQLILQEAGQTAPRLSFRPALTGRQTAGLLAANQSVPESVDQLVVSDLFYVHEFEDRNMIQPAVNIKYKVNLAPHAYLKVFEYVDGEWQLLPHVRNADSTISVQVNQWGSFALVTDLKEESSAVASPQTGVALPMLSIAAATVSAISLMLRKKRDADT